MHVRARACVCVCLIHIWQLLFSPKMKIAYTSVAYIHLLFILYFIMEPTLYNLMEQSNQDPYCFNICSKAYKHKSLKFSPYITSIASKPKAHNVITLASNPKAHNVFT